MDVERTAVLADRGGAAKDFITRPRKQLVERDKTAVPLCCRLRINLLEAKDIGAEALELRPQHGDARLQRRLHILAIIEALEVECGDPQR